MTESQHGGVSLRPEDAGEGGLFDDVTVHITKSRFEMFDYNGTQAVPVPSLRLEMQDTTDKTEYNQNYSMGSAKDWTPSSDGTELLYVGSAENPNIKRNTNGMTLITSIMDSGFDADKFGVDISVFENMVCHMQRIPAPKRSGLAKKERDDGKTFDDTILVVDNIVTMPWETKGAPNTGSRKGKAAGAPKGAADKKRKGGKKDAAASVSSADELVEKATDYLLGAVAAAGDDGLAKKELPVLFVREFETDPDRNKLVALVYNDKFFVDSPFSLENGVITLG